jgi:hypothetical protein
MGKRYVIVELEDDDILQLPPGIASIATIEESDLTLIKSALWQATDSWWGASRDEAMALSDNVEDREASIAAMKDAKQGESVMLLLGHKWLPEHFATAAEYHAAGGDYPRSPSQIAAWQAINEQPKSCEGGCS